MAGALALAGQYADQLVLGTVRDVHGAVARRAFGITNRATRGSARVPQLVHDRISGVAYGGVDAGLHGGCAPWTTGAWAPASRRVPRAGSCCPR